jgi:hypothetical protein
LEKPEYLKDEHLKYLNELKETKMVPMFGAASTLRLYYDYLTKEQARKILAYWIDTFQERHAA